MSKQIKIGHLTLDMGSVSHAVGNNYSSQKESEKYLTYLAYTFKMSNSKFKPIYFKGREPVVTESDTSNVQFEMPQLSAQ